MLGNYGKSIMEVAFKKMQGGCDQDARCRFIGSWSSVKHVMSLSLMF